MPNDNVNGNVKAVLDEISALKREADEFAVSDYRTGYISALSALEGFIAGLPAAGESKWISVKERLPELNTAVIVAVDDGHVFQALYAYDGWELWDGCTCNITHWMPLPRPPGEEE